MNRQQSILISFDVEEFDLPLEYNHYIEPKEQMSTGKKGLDTTLQVLDQHALASTMFTTANFAQSYPLAIQKMAEKHEIASHSFYHTSFELSHLTTSKAVLENITGKDIHGLRMPKMQHVDMKDVIDAGYSYDSSINPVLIPGRYNNLHLPRTVFNDMGMIRMPISVSTFIRIPLFWLTFKNFPYFIFLRLARQALRKDGYLCLYFHPWEFTDLSNYKIPLFLKKNAGEKLQEKLHDLLTDLSKEGDCITINQYLENVNRNKIPVIG